jgi:hypothetical protein
VFSDNENQVVGDDSDSDGFLSEVWILLFRLESVFSSYKVMILKFSAA